MFNETVIFKRLLLLLIFSVPFFFLRFLVKKKKFSSNNGRVLELAWGIFVAGLFVYTGQLPLIEAGIIVGIVLFFELLRMW